MKFIKAVATITVFTVITRVLGFFFRIYLSRQLGAETMGVYQVAISVFVLLLTLTTSGLPLVVSRKSAAYAAFSDTKSQHKTVTSALIISTAVSIGLCALTAALFVPLTMIFPRKESVYILMSLLPCVVFSAICSSMRGQLWGNKKYFAVSSIELIEQIIRIVICVLLLSLKIGDKSIMSGLSLSAACFISAAVCAAMYFKYGGKLLYSKGTVKPLFKDSMAVTGMRAASSLIGSLVAFTVPFALMLAGLPESEAMAKYGAASGMAFPLLFLPSAVIGSLAFALVPELASSQSKGDTSALQRRIKNSVDFSLVVGALFIPLLSGAGEAIGQLIYGNQDAGVFMKYGGWIMIPIAFEHITSSIMNSINLESKGFKNYLLGCIPLFACILGLSKPLGIHAYSLGLGVSLTFSSVLDVIDINKKVGFKVQYLKPLLMSSGFAFACTLIVTWLCNICTLHMPLILSIIISGLTGTLLMAGLAAAFNLFDIKSVFPKSKRIPRQKPAKEIKNYTFLI